MREPAPAKLTLSLRVTGVRDDGFHLLDAEMVSIDLADELEFFDGDDELEVVGNAADGVPADGTNLVIRALAKAGRRARVRLHKRIPAGAGLGGGSSDAAAVLRWAGRSDDTALAASLGADVPFCLCGGRARVTGVGEIVEPMPYEAATFTLVVPPFAVDTARVYGEWDLLGGPQGGAGNDLEPAALVVEPALVEWRDRVGNATGLAPRLAGSGGTWFVEGAFPDLALPPARVIVATTTPPIGESGRANRAL